MKITFHVESVMGGDLAGIPMWKGKVFAEIDGQRSEVYSTPLAYGMRDQAEQDAFEHFAASLRALLSQYS